MPVYAGGVAGTALATPIDLEGATGAQGRLACVRLGSEDTGTTNQATNSALQRATIGSATGVTEEKASTRSPVNRLQTRSALATVTGLGNVMLFFAGGLSHEAHDMWRPARFYASPILYDTEIIALLRSHTRTKTGTIFFDEDPYSKETVRPRRRLARGRGIFHYYAQDQQHRTSAASPVFDIKHDSFENWTARIDWRFMRVTGQGANLALLAGGPGPQTYLRTFTATQDQTATLTRQAQLVKSATQAGAATLARLATVVKAAPQPSAATVTRQPAKTLSTGQAQSATLATLKLRLLTLTASQGQTATLARLVLRTISATQTAAVTVRRAVSRTLTASQGQTASFASIKVKLLALTAAQPSLATVRRTASRALTVAQAATPSLRRLVVRTLTGSQPSSASVSATKAKLLTLTAAQPSTVSLTRQAGRRLLASVGSLVTVLREKIGGGLEIPATVEVRDYATVALALGDRAAATVGLADSSPTSTAAGAEALATATVRDYQRVTVTLADRSP